MALKHVFFNLRDNLRFNWAKHKFGFIPEGTEADFRFAELKKVVVLKLDGKLGDTEVMTHFYSAMRKAQPRLFLCVVCPQHLVPIYKDILGFDLVLTSSRKPKEDEIKKLCAQILNADPRSTNVDLVVTTEPRFRPRDFIFDYYLKPRYVAGCDVRLKGSSINLFLFDPDRDTQRVSACFCDLMDKGGLSYEPIAYVPFVTEESLAKARSSIQKDLGLELAGNATSAEQQKPLSLPLSLPLPLLIGINPCGAPSARRFTVEMVCSIMQHLHQQRPETRFVLLLPESMADFRNGLVSAWESAGGNTNEVLLLPEKSSIMDFASYIHLLDGLITVDTAAVHLACASKVPQLAFYLGDEHTVEDKRWAPVSPVAQVVQPHVDILSDVSSESVLPVCSEFVSKLSSRGQF